MDSLAKFLKIYRFFLDDFYNTLYDVNCPNSNIFGRCAMAVQNQERNYHIIQIMCVMNQLHRLTIHQQEEELPPGFTISQLATIGFLFYQEEREVYQRDLEGFFKLRRSTVSSLLNTLEKKDILRRVPVPHDARLKRLVLTPKGLDVGLRVQKQFLFLNHLLIQGLTPEEQETFARILEKVENNLNAKT
jgi:MarR family transcriptional repressor of mepA